jgi:hypothetical protein
VGVLDIGVGAGVPGQSCDDRIKVIPNVCIEIANSEIARRPGQVWSGVDVCYGANTSEPVRVPPMM